MATLDLAFTPWPLPGPAPALGRHEAHVWRVDLDRSMARWSAALSEADRARAAAIKHAGARASFAETRAALRLILAAYTGEWAEALSLVVDPRGKPRLDGADVPAFNLSHSGGAALVAVTRAGRIGVDLEFVRATPRLDAVATRFFAEAETAALLALPEAARADAFHACWTRKEAYVKADGSGIANALSRFEVSVAPDDPARLVAIDGDRARARAWTLHAFRPAPDAWGAVCVDAPDVTTTGFHLLSR